MRRKLWLGLLALCLLYLALLPRLRRMSTQTARLQRQTAARQTEVARLACLRRALTEARAGVERDPRDAAAQIELAERCSEAGQIDEGARHAQLAAGLSPHDPAALLLLADIR